MPLTSCLRLSAWVLLPLSLAACLSTPGPNTVAGDGRCRDAGLQWAIGQTNDETTARRLKQGSGAGLLNPIPPTTIVSRGLRQDRLRVFVDAHNVITAVRCE